MTNRPIRRLCIILGDQLDKGSPIFDDVDPARDAIWMAEVHEEATHVWCHKLRIAFFFSAMRHFRDELRTKNLNVIYTKMHRRKSNDRGPSLDEVLAKDIREHKPERLTVVEPGDHRVRHQLQETADALGIPITILEDPHFLCSLDEFNAYANGKKSLTLENFYRMLRKKEDILLENASKPVGGKWNFDEDNRDTFGKDGPPEHKLPRRFQHDAITEEVLELVEKRFAKHPGSLDCFDVPVTREHALAYLRDFIEHRLPLFGTYQDAMWTNEDFLFHSRLSCLLNVKLLNPREVIDKAVTAYEDGHAPLNSVEGFVRQVLGWREFARGIYWRHMPEYYTMNELGAEEDIPSFYWHGDTHMECIFQSMRNVINHGYAHHIQRLMVLGLFAQLYGVNPTKFHEWHMAMYLDAIDWASLPNALGMSQYGDGGIMGTKPYCASGAYINRMSNYCKNCKYNPGETFGENACPFTTLYWDFLGRHHDTFKKNRRMTFQIKNYERKNSGDRAAISRAANDLRGRIKAGEV